MSPWDPTWDRVFAAKEWGRYPAEEVVRFASRRRRDDSARRLRVLEIGCGPGANVWFLAREGFEVVALDGSATAINQLRHRLDTEGLRALLLVSDLATLPFDGATFDLVIDSSAIQHNWEEDQRKSLQDVARVLVPGGVLLSVMLAAGSWGEGRGREVAPRTYVEVDEGPAAGSGTVRFASEDDLATLFSPFSRVTYERIERTYQERQLRLVHWIVEAQC